MKLVSYAITLLALALACNTTHAVPYVDFLLAQNPSAGTWQLAIQSTEGDNAGVAAYGVALIGDILTLDHKSPRAGAAENFDGSLSGPMGFTVFRSADGKANKNIGGGQDTLAPTPFLIYGFGQTAGSWQTVTNGPAMPLGSNEGNNWLAKPVIASGTMTPGTWVKLDLTSAFSFADVFVSVDSSQTESARIFRFPEPTANDLAPIGLMGVAIARRRFNLTIRSSQ